MISNEWFSARELAAIAQDRGVKGFPSSKRGVNALASEKGWASLPGNLCRERSAVGGGKEFHVSLLPDVMQDVIHGRQTKALQLVAQEMREEVERKKVASLPVTSLRFRQRQAMEARGEILIAIERYGMERGFVGLRRAILEFVQAQATHAERVAALAKAEAGEGLTHRERMLLEQPSPLQGTQGFGLLVDTLRLANDRCGDRFRIARSTVYEWFSLRDAGGMTALAPALTKEEEPISEEFKAFLTFYCKPSKRAATEVLKDYKEKNPTSTLTIEQVRYTLRHKLNDIERNVGREGLLTLRSRMAYIQRSTENLFPTTIYTADGKTFDAEIEHPLSKKPFKPEITSILDVATRKCVGVSIALKENVIAVTEALRKSCVEHGIPAIFYVDRGPGYKNKTFDSDAGGLMGRLSITKMHALPYNSQAKGIIERFNGTVWNPLAEKLPTYLGAKMDKEAAKAAHKATRSDIKLFGVSHLLPTWEEFREMCLKAITDYNSKPHDGLPRYRDQRGVYRHYSPDEFWALHVADGFEPVPVDAEEVDDLFRPYEVRRSRRGLVEWNNNQYYHKALEAYHGEQLVVGYDFDQARYVWVREIDRDSGQPGRFVCVADYTGNKVDYVPRTYQQTAEEKRRQGRVKRLEDKLRDAQDEFSSPILIEQADHQPMPFIDLGREPITVGPVLVIDNEIKGADTVAGTVEETRRRTFASDEELALWALENPEKLTSNQVRVLRDCLNRQSSAELFRMSGIDLEALRNVLRNVA
ncbi:Mu transposase C-terminal domain-containing protein [Shinella sp. HZN7]|uniref:Mu transposase C-terminal domain-containing protein n=1 Tax=Shinella sp. (strain HZN7) TaxID=879274 RepID=UPI0007DA6B97|nr:Mu transposase C-terminal domain-containing protein [Shinella sp. HZN7]ANH05012.1 integrase catalytic subunit [Shinella sp. HZN7]